MFIPFFFDCILTVLEAIVKGLVLHTDSSLEIKVFVGNESLTTQTDKIRLGEVALGFSFTWAHRQ